MDLIQSTSVNDNGGGPNIGVIIGIVAAVLCVVLLIGLIVAVVVRKQRNQQTPDHAMAPYLGGNDELTPAVDDVARKSIYAPFNAGSATQASNAPTSIYDKVETPLDDDE